MTTKDSPSAKSVVRATGREYSKRRLVTDGVDFSVGTEVHLQMRWGKRRPHPDETADEAKERIVGEQARWVSKDVGGRPPRPIWDAVEQALKAKIAEQGKPTKANIAGWRTSADAERWVDDFIIKHLDKDGAPATTIRPHVRRILNSIET